MGNSDPIWISVFGADRSENPNHSREKERDPGCLKALFLWDGTLWWTNEDNKI